jgi:membrane protein DedA with SNARE-associated domain
MAVMAVATGAWVNYFYGKYARQIKSLLDDLREE